MTTKKGHIYMVVSILYLLKHLITGYEPGQGFILIGIGIPPTTNGGKPFLKSGILDFW